jgi:hypothetical protein
MGGTRFTSALIRIIALSGGLGTAFWAIYHDYRRRKTRNAGWVEATRKALTSGSEAGPHRRSGPERDLLRTGLALLGAGAGSYYFLMWLAPRLASVAYLPTLIGIGYVVAHVAYRLEAGESDKDGP